MSHPQQYCLKKADQEGKVLVKKQYIAYEIIACSFLLSFFNDDAYKDIDNLHKDLPIQKLKTRGGHKQLMVFLTVFDGSGKVSM